MELFRNRFESLGGRVAVAKNADEAAVLAGSFLIENNAGSVFLSIVPSEVESALIKELRKQGIRIYSSNSTPNPANKIKEVDAAVSTAACAVAETGSIVEVAFDDIERMLSSFPKLHISFLKKSSIFRSVHNLAGIIRTATERKSSAVTLISGPSRSGDIEQRLVLGIHGPHVVAAVVMAWL